MQTLREKLEQSARFLVGTELVSVRGGMAERSAVKARAGLPSIAVINAATGVGAERFAYKEKIGRIAAGYRSRLILTEHSPLATVAHLRQPRTIVFDGAVFETALSTVEV